MKEILSFVRWQLKKWKWHDYLWFIGTLMVGFGWKDEGVVFFLGCFICFSIIFGYVIGIQWDAYKRDRNKMFDTIKDGK